MTVLLKDAIKPNLVQTLEGQPVFDALRPVREHRARQQLARRRSRGLKLADYVITESGFGSDMGMEKFLDIVCRVGGCARSAVVLVATVRALKHHGGATTTRAEDRSRAWPRSRSARRTSSRHLGIVRGSACRASSRSTASRRTPTRRSSSSRRLALEYGAVAAEINDGFTERRRRRGRAGARPSSRPASCPTKFDRSTRTMSRRGEDQGDRDEGLRRRATSTSFPRPRPSRRSSRGGARHTADLHGEDASVALRTTRSCSTRPRLHGAGARHPRLHGRRLARGAVRRHQQMPGLGKTSAGVQHRHRRRRPDSRTVLDRRAGLRQAERATTRRSARALAARSPAPGGGSAAAAG